MGHSVWKTARPPARRLGLRAAGQDEGPRTPAVPALLREARDGRHGRPSRGRAHRQAFSKASMLLDKRGRQAYLLVMELFLSLRASSRCCSSTINLDRSSGVLGEQKHRGSAGLHLQETGL